MFYHKFPNTKYTTVKMGTLATRWKDCAALQTYNQISDLLGMKKYPELAGWAFLYSVNRQLRIIFKKGQEIDRLDSYAPYMALLRLVSKSPYSTVVNPTLHSMYYMVGAILGSTRSINARMLSETNMMGALACAKLMAYAFCRYS